MSLTLYGVSHDISFAILVTVLGHLPAPLSTWLGNDLLVTGLAVLVFWLDLVVHKVFG